jgi:uncharacterized protein involved in response to NO
MNATKIEDQFEPYILLFSTGCLAGIIGLAFWIFFQLGFIQFYPRALHGNLMFFGFFWSFVAGFLMTAIPKMTSTLAAQVWEISIGIGLVFFQIVLNVRNLTDASVAIFLVQNIFLLFFILRRFLMNRKVPFFGFVFIPMAFAQSILGVVLFYFYNDRNLLLQFAGEAFIMNLILGLGSRLIPVISRLPNALLPNESSKSDHLLGPVVTLLCINVGYWCDIFNFKTVGAAIRIIGTLFAAIYLLKIFVKPVTWSFVGIGLKTAVILLTLGQVLSLPYFNSELAGQHFIYIGGFSMITLLVATRVMLAHGGQTLNYEISSKRLIFVTLLLFFSALMRFSIGNDISNRTVSYSALLFIIALVIWFFKFFKILNSKLIKNGST